MTWPNHSHIYSNQRKSSVFVNWTKQVCLERKLRWWHWWGTHDIVWNRVPDRRRNKRKRAITKYCLTVCRSIEKRHGPVTQLEWCFLPSAFNTIMPHLLANKMLSMSVLSDMMLWIIDYLTYRSQFVVFQSLKYDTRLEYWSTIRYSFGTFVIQSVQVRLPFIQRNMFNC